FNERAVLRRNVDYIAEHGASPDTFHGLRRGGGGGGGSLQQTVADSGLRPPITRPPPQGYDLNNLATQLRRTNPDIDPETMFDVLSQYQHLMEGPSKDAWERFKYETGEARHNYEFEAGRSDRNRQFDIEERRLDEADRRADLRDRREQERLDRLEKG